MHKHAQTQNMRFNYECQLGHACVPGEFLNLPEGHAEQVLPVYPASHEQEVLPSAEIELLGQSVQVPLPACTYLRAKVFGVAYS
jgi:hypothetical protein